MAQEGDFENVGSGLPFWIEVDKKMNSDTPVTDAAFEAFLHCDTKAYLLRESIDSASKFGAWEEEVLREQFNQRVSERLRSSFGDDEVYVGTPSQRMLEQGSHGIVLRPLIKSSALRAEPDALWRMPPVSGATSFRYTRFDLSEMRKCRVLISLCWPLMRSPSIEVTRPVAAS